MLRCIFTFKKQNFKYFVSEVHDDGIDGKIHENVSTLDQYERLYQYVIQ